MSAVAECLAVTKKLLALANRADETARDEVIEQINGLLNEREQILPLIHGPFSEQDQIAGKELIELNKQVSSFLEAINKNILRDLNELNQKRESAAQYTNPYRSARQNGGAFYDKRS